MQNGEFGVVHTHRPRITVFTTSSRPHALDDSLLSLFSQDFDQWEWVAALVGGVRWRPYRTDRRLRLVIDDRVTIPGAARRLACSVATGDILFELQEGDILPPRSLRTIVQTFDAIPGIAMIAGATAYDGDPGVLDERFPQADGWEPRATQLADQCLTSYAPMDPSPHNVSDVRLAAGHAPAIRRSVYEACGGYDGHMAEASSHDLACRAYQHGAVHVLDEVLYVEQSAPPRPTSEVRLHLYRKHVEANAMAWARRGGLDCLDLGGESQRPEGYSGLRDRTGNGIDAAAFATGTDLPDSTVGLLRMYDVLPRVADKVGLFNEAHRVLAHGGLMMTMTPSTDGRGAFQDPEHVAFYNESSFRPMTDETVRRDPGLTCRFQVSELSTGYPTDWHEQHKIPYVAANLIAIKDGPRQGGSLEF